MLPIQSGIPFVSFPVAQKTEKLNPLEDFFCACWNGNLDWARDLKKQYPSIHQAKDTYGDNILFEFCSSCTLNLKQQKIVQWLIQECQMDLEEKDAQGHTVAWQAMIGGNLSLFKIVLKNGANPNEGFPGCPRRKMLHYLITEIDNLKNRSKGDFKMIQLLVKAGADINALDENNQTPLDLTCNQSDCVLFGLLWELGAKTAMALRVSCPSHNFRVSSVVK